jgi:hypothetical protein
MKKSVFVISLFLVLFLVFAINFIYSETLGGVEDKVEDANEKIEEYSDQRYWEEKWDYLGKEWKAILLKNKGVATVDSFFRQISIVFFVLFALDYEMSLVLLGVIILWFILWSVFANGVMAVGLKNSSSLIIAVLMVVALAHIGLIQQLVVFAGRIAFSPESAWARTIIIGGIAFVLFFVNYISVFIKKYAIAKRLADAKHLEEFNRTYLMNFVNSFRDFSSIRVN